MTCYIDECVHTLVGYGRHGKADIIQDLHRQACGRKFSVRWGTARYRLKTSSTKVALIVALMAEGVEVSALERVLKIMDIGDSRISRIGKAKAQPEGSTGRGKKTRIFETSALLERATKYPPLIRPTPLIV